MWPFRRIPVWMRKAQEVCPAPSSEGYVKLLGRTILFYEEQSEGFDIFVYVWSTARNESIRLQETDQKRQCYVGINKKFSWNVPQQQLLLGTFRLFSFYLYVPVPQSPNLLNSARYHGFFQNFVVHGKCTFYIKN